MSDDTVNYNQIDEMAAKFKDFADLKAYSGAQYRTIVEQSKKIHALEEEIIHLRKLLENGGSTLIKDPANKIEIYADVTDQEAICRIELKKLKDISIERELTLEEAKRTEIYTKLLLSLTEKSKAPADTAKRLDDSQLLALLTDDAAIKTFEKSLN
jgi:hypothetical protein